jgi:hypothetical protein
VCIIGEGASVLPVPLACWLSPFESLEAFEVVGKEMALAETERPVGSNVEPNPGLVPRPR